MFQRREFYRQHVANYLDGSRRNGKQDSHLHTPPSSRELEELIDYLNKEGSDPIIVGSVALVIHLNLHKEIQATRKESFPLTKKVDLVIRNACSDKEFRPTQDIDVFISKNGVPKPPIGWTRDRESVGIISWISPSGGYVDFLIAGHEYPDQLKNPLKIEKDPISEAQGCPVADVTSLFLLKLNSNRVKDFEDLVEFSRIVGIPSNLRQLSLNAVQRDNLNLITEMIKYPAPANDNKPSN